MTIIAINEKLEIGKVRRSNSLRIDGYRGTCTYLVVKESTREEYIKLMMEKYGPPKLYDLHKIGPGMYYYWISTD